MDWMKGLDDSILRLSQVVGFPVDQLKFLICLLLGYPAGFAFRKLQQPASKHLFSIILSIVLSTFSLGPSAFLHTIFSSTITYLIMKFLPHGMAHKVNLVFVLLYMSLSHIYRMYVDYMGWTMDYTTVQMVLTLKLSSFGFNYYDGNCNSEKLTETQKKRAIKELPGLLEYYGFVFFFCGYLAGPHIEIKEYQDFISLEQFRDEVCKGRIPPTTVPALTALSRGILMLPILILQSKYPTIYLTQPKYLYETPFYEQMFRMWLHPTLSRMKYYFGWYVSEGAFIACGASYNGKNKDGTIKWDRFVNVYISMVEAAVNIRSITMWWNIRTADWLKEYIYLRLAPEGQKPTLVATVTTYAVSAFWHGFYPGYYLFFLTTALYTEVAKDMRRILRWRFVDEEEEKKRDRKSVV